MAGHRKSATYPEVSLDYELLTRTSWADAATAYRQIKRGKLDGNENALLVRRFLQLHMYRLGAFIQQHCGKVLFVGLLLLSLCCVGLKSASIETDVEKLWVQEGGRLEKELKYTKEVLGEGNGMTNELVIQRSKPAEDGVSGNVLTAESLKVHLEAMKKVSKLTVDVFDIEWTFEDICYKANFPSTEEPFFDTILEKLTPCIYITPLDCFWDGAKLLGPDPGIYVPTYDVWTTWQNLDPTELLEDLGSKYNLFPKDMMLDVMNRAGISHGYMDKPCLDPTEPQCPNTAPNKESKQPPDIGAELTGGCSGFAKRFMHWEEDLIIGGIHKNRSRVIRSAEALQSVIVLQGEKELFEYYRDHVKTHRMEWNQEKAKTVLETWHRKFSTELAKLSNDTSNYKVLPFSATSLVDLLTNFSNVSVIRILIGYILMLMYASFSLMKWSDLIRSQSGIGIAGVLLVCLSVASGLGMCSVLGIAFNAATTQIAPFLALGLGVDDMFLLAHAFAENSRKDNVDYMLLTGTCLKKTGVSILLTSFSNACAFFAAAIIPIPALRAFCIQTGILILFNAVSMLVIFPAMISIDLARRQSGRMDIMCCFKGLEKDTYMESYDVRDETPPPPYFSVSGQQMYDLAVSTNPDGSCPTSKMLDEYPDRRRAYTPLNAVGPGPMPAAWSEELQQSRRGPGCCQRCAIISHGACCCMDLAWLARHHYAPLLEKMPTKVFVILGLIMCLIFGVIGTLKVEDGLDLKDVVPRGTNQHDFLKTQDKYFGFYNMYLVTKDNFDYPNNQKLLHEYHQAFSYVDKIIKKEDGSLPDFWLQLFRDWLIDIQNELDREIMHGHINKTGWTSEATDDAILGYKLLLQTGNIDHPVNLDRFDGGRLVNAEGIIYPHAFYTYLTAWTSLDALAYTASQANFHPLPKTYYHIPSEKHVLRIPASQPFIYVQSQFFLNKLGETTQVTETIKEVRGICELFEEQGLPNFPSGLPFTFWEQYIFLRFYLIIALICILFVVFLVLTIVLVNPWAATLIVFVLGTSVVELLGCMGFLGIKLSAVPAVILIVSVGIGVEFTVHILIGFLTAVGSRNWRMSVALEHMMAPVIHGAISTLLGIVMLASAEFEFIVKYFFIVMLLIVVIGVLNGLVLLPVLLSIIGPKGEVRTYDGMNRIAPPTPQPSPRMRHRSHNHHYRSQQYGGRHRQVRRSSSAKLPKALPSELSLSTIAEESSGQYSSHEIIVQPEVIVETTIPGVNGAYIQNVDPQQSSVHTYTSKRNSIPPGHVTTVKATANIKVKVHTPQDQDHLYKNRRRKIPEVCDSWSSDESELSETKC